MLRATNESVRFLDVLTEQITTTALLNFRLDPEQTEDFSGLMDSIRKYGLLQPLLVREIVSDNSRNDRSQPTQRFQLVSGHRRYFACRRLGLAFVPCRVMVLNDQEAFEVALIENVQRQSLNPIEEAEAFKSYVVNFGRGSITRLARKIGKSEEYVSHRLLLLGLPKALVERISRRLLNPSHATELVWLKDENQKMDLSNEISKHSLSLREVRAVIRMIKGENLLVLQAVQQVLQEREARVTHSRSSLEYVGSELRDDEVRDPWQTYSNSLKDGESSNEKEILDRAVLAVRTCLAGLDLLVDQAHDFAILPDILMKERKNVHTILDELIRTATSYERNRIIVSPTA